MTCHKNIIFHNSAINNNHMIKHCDDNNNNNNKKDCFFAINCIFAFPAIDNLTYFLKIILTLITQIK